MKRIATVVFSLFCVISIPSIAAARDVIRLTLELSDTGEGKFRIEKTSQPPADDFPGTPFEFSSLPKTKATKGKEGTFRLAHDFSDADEPSALAFDKPVNVTLNKQAGVMVFTPGPLPQGFDAKTGAVFYYGKKLKLPLSIRCDIVELGGGGFGIQLGDPTRKLGLLQCKLGADSTDTESPFEVAVQWSEIGVGDKPHSTTLRKKKDVTLREPFEMSFSLPVPKAKISKAFQLGLYKAAGNGPATVARLEVQGRVALIFGLALTGKQGVIVAQSVAPNSLAAKAGFQPGDVLTAINGKRFQSAVEAVDILSRLPVGEEAKFSILRAKKSQELRVMAE
jgi:hypothetical protein